MKHEPLADLEVERYEFDEATRYRFEIERRDFMRIFAAMGGGLLVVASLPDVEAQESGRGGQGRPAIPRDISAWVHIDERGQVTGYTGKTSEHRSRRRLPTNSACRSNRSRWSWPIPTSCRMTRARSARSPRPEWRRSSHALPQPPARC
jgi:hypothetical protein